MSTLTGFFQKHREILMYLIFGVLTTIVGWTVYTVCFFLAEHTLGISLEDKGSLTYLSAYIIIQILQWIAAVLFSFFTNRAWVFTDAEHENRVVAQLLLFATSRLATLGLDIVATYGGIRLFVLFLSEAGLPLSLFGFEMVLTPEVLSKVVTAVLVVIANYVLSKWLVFRKKKA